MGSQGELESSSVPRQIRAHCLGNPLCKALGAGRRDFGLCIRQLLLYISCHCIAASLGQIVGLFLTNVKTSKESQSPKLTHSCTLVDYQDCKTPTSHLILSFSSPGRDTMADTQTCYYPDGTVALNDKPCHSSSIGDGSSACCGAHTINLVDVDGGRKFCCGNMNPFNNTCLNGTRGSFLPFSVQAGLVINNRTSGSTSPNSTDTTTVVITSTAPGNVAFTATTTATVTVTATAKAAASDPPSRGDTAVAAGLGSLLGLGLLIASSVLWKQRKRNQSLRKDVDEWKEKYSQSTKTKTVYVGGAEQQSPHQHDSRIFNELDEQSCLPAHHETDGAQIYEAVNRSRRA